MDNLEAMRKVLRNAALATLRGDEGGKDAIPSDAVALVDRITNDDGRRYVVVVTANVQVYAEEIT